MKTRIKFVHTKYQPVPKPVPKNHNKTLQVSLSGRYLNTILFWQDNLKIKELQE